MGISYFVLAYKYIYTGNLNNDEGFYLLSAKKVMDGELLYRDFGYPQMPALPYLNGAVMKIVGFGFVEQRFINAFWGTLLLLLIIILGISHKDPKPFLYAGLILSTSPFWIYYTCIGKTYAATNFFMALTAFGILFPMKYHNKVIVSLVGGLLAIGCRLSMAPFVFLLWGILLLHSDTKNKRIVVICFYFIICIIFFLPFYLTAPENFIFWNIEFNAGSTLNRRGWQLIYELFTLAPGALLLASAGIFILFRRLQYHKFHEIGIFITAVAGVIFHLSFRSSWGEYSTPFIAILSLSAAIIASKSKTFNIIIIISFLSPLIYLKAPLPDIDQNIIALIQEPSNFIQESVPKGSKILTPLPIIAVQAGYNVIKGTEMGQFGLTTEIDVERARRLRLLPYEDLITLVESQTPKALVFWNNQCIWNYFFSVPSLKPIDNEWKNIFCQKLFKNYYIAFYNTMFIVLLPK
jgi:hypothetical protein